MDSLCLKDTFEGDVDLKAVIDRASGQAIAEVLTELNRLLRNNTESEVILDILSKKFQIPRGDYELARISLALILHNLLGKTPNATRFPSFSLDNNVAKFFAQHEEQEKI